MTSPSEAVNTSASVFIRLCSCFIFHVGGRENKTLINDCRSCESDLISPLIFFGFEADCRM